MSGPNAEGGDVRQTRATLVVPDDGNISYVAMLPAHFLVYQEWLRRARLMLFPLPESPLHGRDGSQISALTYGVTPMDFERPAEYGHVDP